MSEACPRCSGEGPCQALSRVDNKTYVCSQCGTDEAMFELLNPGVDLPPINEPVPLTPGQV